MNMIATKWVLHSPGKRLDECPRIEAVLQLDMTFKFAVRQHGNCLSKDRKWEYEPMPSSRDDNYLMNFRFDSFQEAASALEDVV